MASEFSWQISLYLGVVVSFRSQQDATNNFQEWTELFWFSIYSTNFAWGAVLSYWQFPNHIANGQCVHMFVYVRRSLFGWYPYLTTNGDQAIHAGERPKRISWDLRRNKWLFHQPRCSMVLVYLPTKLGDVQGNLGQHCSMENYEPWEFWGVQRAHVCPMIEL